MKRQLTRLDGHIRSIRSRGRLEKAVVGEAGNGQIPIETRIGCTDHTSSLEPPGS
jgi:hypothetical protein